MPYLHKASPMVSFRGETVMIDLNIQGVIQLLWDNDVRTFFCCEGFRPRVDLPESGVRQGYITVAAGRHDEINGMLPTGWFRRWDTRVPKVSKYFPVPYETVRFVRTYDVPNLAALR